MTSGNSVTQRICLTPYVSGVGGMVSFRLKFSSALEKRGVLTTNSLADFPYGAVLVIGGTRNLSGLWQAKRRGIPIVQRLNGMNWLHKKVKTGLQHYLKAEYGNLLLNLIRTRIATKIIYQSDFSKQWWERVHGPTPVPNHIVHNGVDLDIYHPEGPGNRPSDYYQILLVEGSLGGGYEMGLENAVHLCEKLVEQYNLPVNLAVVGKVSPEFQQTWDIKAKIRIQWQGLVSRDKIPELDRSAHLLFSADLNPACPNAVIEALGCGLPVIAFDTGALRELVPPDAGRVVPYGGSPWDLDPPDIEGLAAAAAQALGEGNELRKSARRWAVSAFGIEKMVDSYLSALL